RISGGFPLRRFWAKPSTASPTRNRSRVCSIRPAFFPLAPLRRGHAHFSCLSGLAVLSRGLQCEMDRQSAVVIRPSPNASTVRFYDRLLYSQPEPQTLILGREEGLEQLRQALRR